MDKLIFPDGREYVPFVRRDENLRVPMDGKYIQALRDEFVLGDVRQKTQGTGVKYPFPAIVNKEWGWRVVTGSGAGKKEHIYYYMPDEWQWFLWNFFDWSSNYLLPKGEVESYYTNPKNSGIFANATPGSLTWLYINMIEVSRAWTDASNVEGGARDVVTGRNITAKKPYEWLLRICTGHMMKVTADLGTNWEVSCIDMLKPPPPMSEVEKHPEWICWATQVHIDRRTTRFPWVKEALKIHDYPEQGTAVPLMAPGGRAIIKKSACKELVNGEAWSPYYPT